MTSPPTTLPSRARAAERVRRLERRVQRFDALSDEERRVLAVVGLFPGWIWRHVVIQMCDLVSSRDSTRAVENARLTVFAQKWQQLDLVHVRDSEIRCDPDLSAHLVRRIEDTPFGLPIRLSVKSNPSWWVTLNNPLDHLAYETRLLRLSERASEAGTSAARFLQCCRSEAQDLAVLFGPGDPWFVPTHVSGWKALLADALEVTVRGLGDVSWELELLEAHSEATQADPQSFEPRHLLLPADLRNHHRTALRDMLSSEPLDQGESYRRLWYTWHLFQGDDQLIRDAAARHLLAGYTEVEAFVAIADLSQANLEPCLERLARACIGPRRNALSATQNSWVGVVRVLALLASDSSQHALLAGELIQRWLSKRSCHSDELAAVFQLADYAARQNSTMTVLPGSAQPPQSAISVLLALILRAWQHHHTSTFSEWIAVGQHMRALADALAHQWLVDQFDAAIGRLQALYTDDAQPEHNTAPTALVELMTQKPDWAMTLDSMGRIADSVLPPPPSHSPAAEPTARIAWLIELREHQLYAEPRLQSKKGSSFSRGKPIALERLLAGADQSLPITAADKAIAAHITRGFPSRGQAECTLQSGFCVAMVGHPYVFDRHDESLHYAVKRGHVRLRCVRLNDGPHRLYLEPHVDADGHESQFVAINGRELIVYELTDNLRKLSKLIGGELLLPAEAGPRLQQLLPRLSTLLPTSANLELEPSAVIPSDTLPVLRIRPRADSLRVRCVVTPLGPRGIACPPGEGDVYLADNRAGQTLHVQRDLSLERERARILLRLIPSLRDVSDDFEGTVRGTAECLTLISELSELSVDVARVEWPEGEPLKLRRVRALSVAVRRGTARNWFEAEGAAQLSDDAEVQLVDLVQQIRHADGRFVRISSNDYLELGQSTLDRLRLLDAFRQTAETRAMRMAPWIALAWPEDSLHELVEAGCDSWSEWLHRVIAVNRRKPQLAPGFVGTLRDYQLVGFEWLVRMAELGSGACLADDMGLGKTIQTLALLLHRATRELSDGERARPILIVAPASVCPGWIAEAARFTPELELRWLSGSERNLQALTRRTVVICTYEILYRDREQLSQVDWDTVVLDEAQQIKNAHTHRARAAFSLHAEFRLATTGTPIENHLGELWSLFRFLMPGLLGEQHEFVERFRSPIENDHDVAARQQLQTLVRPFLLRRTKQQVLSELPSRTELVRQVELSRAELELYESVRQRGLMALSAGPRDRNQLRIRVLAELMRLRRVCCHPKLVLEDSDTPSSKLAALLELVDELREGGHRALIFSQFVDHLSLVREALDDRGIRYQYLDGSTPVGDRARRVDAFQSGSGDLFLISLRAGGVGLNLTGADYVIHLDPWWNPAVEDQASDRAHRIGQERPVTVYRLVARGTIEERLITMHSEKRKLAADILQGSEESVCTDPDDLINLLRDAGVVVSKVGASGNHAIDSHPE